MFPYCRNISRLDGVDQGGRVFALAICVAGGDMQLWHDGGLACRTSDVSTILCSWRYLGSSEGIKPEDGLAIEGRSTVDC